MIDQDHALHWLFARPIAHRGLHRTADGLIENSPSAFAAAIAQGFGIECDVQLTRDGQAVVFHDFTLDRLTRETGNIADHDSRSLRTTALRGSADTVPLLSDVIEQVSSRVPLVVEIKSRFNGDLRLAEIVADIVRMQPSGIALKSFDADIVAYLRVALPDVPRGFIGMNEYEHSEFAHLSQADKQALAKLGHFERMKPDFLSWRVKELPEASAFLRQASHHVPIMSWTVRTQEDQLIAREHADQIVFEGFLPQA